MVLLQCALLVKTKPSSAKSEKKKKELEQSGMKALSDLARMWAVEGEHLVRCRTQLLSKFVEVRKSLGPDYQSPGVGRLMDAAIAWAEDDAPSSAKALHVAFLCYALESGVCSDVHSADTNEAEIALQLFKNIWQRRSSTTKADFDELQVETLQLLVDLDSKGGGSHAVTLMNNARLWAKTRASFDNIFLILGYLGLSSLHVSCIDSLWHSFSRLAQRVHLSQRVRLK